MRKPLFFISVTMVLIISSCKPAIKKQKDELYSRHLQERVQLTVFGIKSEEKTDVQLLLINGKLADENEFGNILDETNKKNKLASSLIVCIGSDVFKENSERNAEKYSSFINNELIPFVKKKSGIRKFKTISIAGIKNAGEYALVYGWDNADKISKVGMLYAFEKTGNENAIAQYISDSKKRPDIIIRYYARGSDTTNEMIQILRQKKSIADKIIFVQSDAVKKQEAPVTELPEILLWLLND